MQWLCKSDRYDKHLYVIDIERRHTNYYYAKKDLSRVNLYSSSLPVNLQEELIRVCVPYTYLNGGD